MTLHAGDVPPRRTSPGRVLLDASFARFLVVGGANTALGAALFWAFLRVYAGHRYAAPLAQATTYVVGVAISFVANRRWTFRSDGAARGELPRFLTAHLGALTLSTGLIQLGASAGLPVAVCFVATLGVTTVLNYAVQRLWVFRPTPG